MSELRDAALRELQRLEQQLEKELAANPTFLRITKVKAFLADYPDDGPPVPAQPMLPSLHQSRPVDASAGERLYRGAAPRSESRKSRVVAIAGALIDQGGGTTTRQAIISAAIAQQLVPNDIKRATKIVAPILSEATQYRSDGKGNWTRAAVTSSSPQGETGGVAPPVSH